MKDLTPMQNQVLKLKATEEAGTGRLLHHSADGMFNCAGCGQQLFASNAKFNSGSGWPSFDQAIEGATKTLQDISHGMIRMEVVCAQCGGHLGHLFDDGPQNTTGQRFCINSCALDFQGADGERVSGAPDSQ